MFFALLRRLLAQSPRQRGDLHFLIYTRANCPLCDEARNLLDQYRQRFGFRLESMNVDDSPELKREYGDWVPVVSINGHVRFRGRVNEVLLRRILDV